MSSFEEDLANAQKLLEALGRKHHDYLDVLTLYDRLKENVDQTILHGNTQDLRTERSSIRRQLQRFSLDNFRTTIEKLEKKLPTAAPEEPSATIPPPRNPKEVSPPSRSNGKTIFISHTTLDDEFVVRLAEELVKAGFQVWHDGKDIKVSQSIPAEINKGLAKCDYFVIVLTPESVASHWVNQEIDAAFAGKRVILPVLLRDCERPPLIQATKFADFRKEFTAGLQSLLEALPQAATVDLTPALRFIYGIIERACKSGDLSPEQEETLKRLIMSIALKKQRGEEIMPPANSDNTSEMFAYTSQVLIFDMLSLNDYHAEWPHLVVSDSFKTDSINLLGKMTDQVLISSALIQQVTRQDVSDEIEPVLTPLQSLQSVLRNIDDHLLSGKVPYHVRNEIERYFDDITFHLNKYLLLLHELANSSDPSRPLQ